MWWSYTHILSGKCLVLLTVEPGIVLVELLEISCRIPSMTIGVMHQTKVSIYPRSYSMNSSIYQRKLGCVWLWYLFLSLVFGDQRCSEEPVCDKEDGYKRLSFHRRSLLPSIFSTIPSAKDISVWVECLRQSGCAPSELSETHQWRITPHLASIPCVALLIALRSPFGHLFSVCLSSILNKHYGVVANSDHTSEWVHWVNACIGIATQWVPLRKHHIVFLLH